MGKRIPFYLNYLCEVYEAKRKTNESYSLRAFSNFLDIDSSLFTKVMARKKVLSLNNADKIIAKLKQSYNTNLREQFLQSVSDELACATLNKHDSNLTDCS